MTRIKDIVTEGAPEELSASLHEKIDALERKAAEVHHARPSRVASVAGVADLAEDGRGWFRTCGNARKPTFDLPD